MRINFYTFNNNCIRPKLRSFKGFDCDESSFAVKRVYNLPCPVCSIPMMQDIQIEIFVNKAKNLQGEELIGHLKKYEKYYHSTEAKVANILISEAKKYPYKGIQALAQNYAETYKSEISKQQADEIRKIKNQLNRLPQEVKDAIGPVFEKYIDSAKEGKFIKREFENYVKSVIPPKYVNQKKLDRMINKIPEANREEYKFITKFGYDTPAKLASSLVTPAFATCEHVVPKSLGGRNHTENYLAECQECNSKRNNTPFDKWVSGIKKFRENFIKYLSVVSEKIQSGEIPIEYVDYPYDISKTIAIETKGSIDVESQTQILETPDDKTNTGEEFQQSNSLSKKLEAKKRELETLEAFEQELLKDDEYCNILKYYELLKKKDKIIASRTSLKIEIANMQSARNKYFKNLISINELQEKILDARSEKEAENLKNRLRKTQKNADQVNILELENKLRESIQNLQATHPALAEINESIKEYEQKIVHSDDIKQQIQDIKVKLFRHSKCSEEISRIRREIFDRNKLQGRILNIQNELDKYTSENKTLNCLDATPEEIKNYKDSEYVLQRFRPLEELCRRVLGDKFQEFDTMLFKFAKDKAEENLEKLYQESNYTRYQINLNKIEELTKELRSCQNALAKYLANEARLHDLNNELASIGQVDDLTSNLEQLEARLKDLEIKYKNTNISAKIRSLKDEIEEIEQELAANEKAEV